MNPIRIIPRLDVKGANLVKGIHLEGLRVLGIPERFSVTYFQDGADELIYMDTVASLYGRNSLEEIVKRTAKNIFVPITVGGGIRSIEDIQRILRAGADKVTLNTAAIKNPKLITDGAKVFGSQCIVVSIEAIKVSGQKYEAYTDNGREPTGKDVVDWAKQVEELGAGEILVTSVDQEGTGNGYDLNLINRIEQAVSIPIIACGGAGSAKDVEEVVNKCHVDAVSASSIFHYNTIKEIGIEKRDEGNVEYLKSFFEGNGSIQKKLKPISVANLKGHLQKLDMSRAVVRLSTKKKDATEKSSTLKTSRASSNEVTLIDYGKSNLFSVEQAFNKIGANVTISDNPEEISQANKIVLAGVGAFHDTIKALHDRGLVKVIQKYAVSGKPILGICLGLQLFMSKGEEFGFSEGLGLIKGKTVRLKETENNGLKVKIPHIGWNKITYPHKEVNHLSPAEENNCLKTAILKDVSEGDFVYFVHSYVVIPEDKSTIISETEFGPNQFCSILKKDNIMGCQFHPEKSGMIGLQVLRNFVFEY